MVDLHGEKFYINATSEEGCIVSNYFRLHVSLSISLWVHGLDHGLLYLFTLDQSLVSKIS